MILRTAVFAGALMLSGAPAALADTPVPRLKPDVPNYSDILNDTDFAAFRRGMRAADEDDWSNVRRARDQISNEVAGDLLLWRMAVSDPRTHFEELRMAVQRLEGWPRDWMIRREAEWKMPEAGMSPARVVGWYETHPPVTGEGRVAFGEALIELGRVEEGQAEIRRAWRTESLRLSNQSAVLREHGDLFTQDDHAARVDHLLWNGQRTAASRLMPELSAGERRVAEARIRLASRGAGVDQAVDAVPESLSSHPGLIYERARWRRRAGLDTSLDLLLELPGAHISEDALESMWTQRKLMILDLIRDADFDTAYQLASNNGMTEGVDFADAEFLAGWLALTKLDDADSAYGHFERLQDGVTTPVSLSRAKYWQGRAAEAMGDLDLARERFIAAAEHPTAYYGQLAVLALGPDAAQIDLPPDPTPTPEQRDAFEARKDIQAVRMLAEVDADYFFRVFIYHYDDQMETPIEQAMLADLALEFFRLRQSVRAAKAGRMQGMILAERAYPVIDLPEGAPIVPEAALTYSVIRQETEFDARAVSGAGARGLMQMMPATARQTARQLNLPFNFSWLTDDPNYNLQLGMAHLDEVVNDYDGSLVMALAAYNAGGHRVRRWVETYGDPRTGEIDPIDWVESIPFSETRNYVQRVIENVQVYRARLNDGPAQLRIEEDMAGRGQFARDLPALPEDFVSALREVEDAVEASEEAEPRTADEGPYLVDPEAENREDDAARTPFGGDSDRLRR
ncbi:MAG: lytic transglycosylase domain-containing protein [Oceanicaulis sp.]